MFDLNLRPANLFNYCYPCSLSNCISCIFHALICVACHACHTFLKTLYECMFMVNCLMFRLTERNEDLSTVEAPTSPYCQRQVAYS